MLPSASPREDDIASLLERAAQLLPAQGPIGVFIHHNTLHAFEGEPFDSAVIRAATTFGTEPFLTETRYREELARGRIRPADVDAVIDAEPSAPLAAPLAGGRFTLRDLHRVLLFHAVRQESDAAVRWTLTEGDVLERLRDDLPEAARRRILEEDPLPQATGLRLSNAADTTALEATFARAGLDAADHERRVCSELWHACVEAVALSRPTIAHGRPPVRHRDLIQAFDPTIDTDELVHPLLIRL
jgi:hypothetical protein